MATRTYTTLVDDLRREMGRDTNDTDFTAHLDTIFDEAERRVARELNLSDLHTETTGSLTINVNTLTRPQNVTAIEYLEVRITSTSWRRLKERPAAWVKEFWPDPTLTGPPRYFGLLNKTQFIVGPTPDAAYPYKLGHRKHDPAVFLSGSVATNVLTEEYPDLLLAALCERAARFARFDKAEADALQGKWEATYQNLKRGVVGVETAEGTSSFEAGTNVEQA